MRVRQGFVSNSSSSSFICEVSGRVEAGYDISLDEAGMYCCVNNHYFDESYLLESPDDGGEDDYAERIGLVESGNGQDEWDEDHDDRYDVPANRCPICTMTHISDKDILDYVLKTRLFGTRKSLSKEMKEKYGEYKNFIKENK
jgi:uncharacterized C2H2 Zn-finger protein